MRIPHTIPGHTLRAYKPSEQTLTLEAERFRVLRAEDLTWDEFIPPTLAQICIKVLCANFKDHNQCIHYLPQQDLDYYLEVLSVDLPIHLVAPIIQDGIYWQRCCESRWTKEPLNVRDHGGSWKRMYVEKHVEEYIHYQEPGYIDWDDVSKLMDVCAPFVVRLNIRELKPPRSLLPDPIPPDECIRGKLDPEHMDLSPVIKILFNLEELTIRFGVRNCGMNYIPDFFKVSLSDINNLKLGLENSKILKTFRLHRSEIDDGKVNLLLSALINCPFLETLEISHCKFGDIAAKSMGKLILEHKRLKNLLIQNNEIGSEGILGISFALSNEGCCPLLSLDLQFNLIGDSGAEYLSSALTKNMTLEELNLGGTGMTTYGAIKVADSLHFNHSIRRIVLSNNHLGTDAAEKIISAAQTNRRIETLDVRNCGLGNENDMTIHKCIAKNRQISRTS